MATRYVSSNPAGSNTSPYDTLAKAATLWGTAISGAAAGDIFAFSNLHNETTAGALTETLPGTAASPNQGFSFDNTQTTLAANNLLAGATVQTSGANNLSINGDCWIYGVTFITGSGASAANLQLGSTATVNVQHYENCAFQMGTTLGSAVLRVNGSVGANNHIEFTNTTVQFGNVTQTIDAQGDAKFIWKNTPAAVTGATIPTGLFRTTFDGVAIIEGVDLTAIISTSHLVSALTNPNTLFFFKDCKIAAGIAVAVTPAVQGAKVYFTRCDSIGSVNRFDVYDYAATETSEANITRFGGAVDFAGNPWSKKVVTTANAQFIFPYECEPISQIITPGQVGVSHTITVYGTINAGAVPNNDDIWIELTYLKETSDPMGGFVNSTKANPLATGTALTADTSNWNGGGSGAGWSPFLMSVTFTPQLPGPLTLKVKAAKISTTYYIDPLPVIV